MSDAVNDQIYSMDYSKPGLVVIFNYKYFNDQSLDRPGSEYDVANLHNLFECFNFKVETHLDKTSTQTRDLINRYSNRDYTEDSSLIVFIMSYGHTGLVLASDNNEIYTDEFINPFKLVKTLKNKPKLFFLQTCEAINQIEEPDLSLNPRRVTVSIEDDFLFSNITIQNLCYHIRPQKGSDFIQYMCKIISDEPHREISDLLTQVNEKIKNTNEIHTISDFNSMFTKQFYFIQTDVIPLNDFQTVKKLAQDYFDKGLTTKDYNEKVLFYSNAIELDSNYLLAYINKGYALNNLHRHDEAIQCYDKCIQIDPNYSGAYNNKGFALDNLERFEEAIECFDKCIQIDKNSSLAYYNKGNALTGLVKYQEAIQCFDKAIQIDKNDSNAYVSKGYALNNLERYEEAIDCYNKAIEINPNNSNAYVGKGFALDHLKMYQEALQLYEKAIQIEPNDTDAHNNKKILLTKLQSIEIEAKKKSAKDYFDKGLITKDYNEKVIFYSNAIELDPNYSDAYYKKGAALYHLKKYEEAIQSLDKAIEIDPDNAIAYSNKGAALDNLKRYNEAIQNYNQAIKINPNYSAALKNKGAALYNLKRHQDAIDCFDKAIEINQNDSKAYFGKGNALYHSKRYDEAIQSFDKAIQIDQNYSGAYFARGNALHNLKRYEEAIKSFDKTMQLSPNSPYALINKKVAMSKLQDMQYNFS